MDYQNKPGMVGGPITMACEPPRISEVANQMNTLNQNLDMLDKSITNLSVRLSPILSPSKPSNVKNSDQLSMQTDLAKLLQAYNNRLSGLIEAINEYHGRIEI